MKSSQCAGEEDLSWQWNKRQMMNEPVGRMSEESSSKERARDESVADNGRQPD